MKVIHAGLLFHTVCKSRHRVEAFFATFSFTVWLAYLNLIRTKDATIPTMEKGNVQIGNDCIVMSNDRRRHHS